MTPIAQMVGAVAHFPVTFVFTSWADDINLSPAPASSHAFTCCEEICATADHQLLSCVTVNPLSVATWLLLPHFLLLPLDHGPLVDLALNPNLITIDDLHVIVSSFTPLTDSHWVDWLGNPLIKAWLTAVSLWPSPWTIHLDDQGKNP